MDTEDDFVRWRTALEAAGVSVVRARCIAGDASRCCASLPPVLPLRYASLPCVCLPQSEDEGAALAGSAGAGAAGAGTSDGDADGAGMLSIACLPR